MATTTKEVLNALAAGLNSIKLGETYSISFDTPVTPRNPNCHAAPEDVDVYPMGYIYPEGMSYQYGVGRIDKEQHFNFVVFCAVAAQASAEEAESSELLEDMMDKVISSVEKFFFQNPQIGGTKLTLLRDTDDDRGGSATRGTVVFTISSLFTLKT